MYVKLSLRDPEVTRDYWVKCYGWTKHFPEWRPKGHWSGKYWMAHEQTSRSSPASRHGKRLRICRLTSKGGYPAGHTNCFRVSGSCTDLDLARLAAATAVPWGWMETRFHERRTRDRWLQIAASAKI
jgi:hypothetical protein